MSEFTAPDFTPMPIDDAWMTRRRDMHERYETLAGLNDASRLGYLIARGVDVLTISASGVIGCKESKRIDFH